MTLWSRDPSNVNPHFGKPHRHFAIYSGWFVPSMILAPISPSSQSVSSYLKSSQFLLRIEEPSAFSWPGPSTKSHSEVWRQSSSSESRHLIEFPFFSSDRKPLLQKKRHTDTKSNSDWLFIGFKSCYYSFNTQKWILEVYWTFKNLKNLRINQVI